MLAILERLIRARAAADIGHTQIQTVKLITTDKQIRQKCNELIQGSQELKELIDKKLIKIRPQLEEYLTMDFEALSKTVDMDQM